MAAPLRTRRHPPYRREGDFFLIELSLSSLKQLFDARDPAPFIEKDLDPDAEDYFLDSLRELPTRAKFRIVVHLRDAPREAAEEIGAAIRNYFAYRTWASDVRFREMLRGGRSALLLGLVFLSVCLVASELVRGADWGFGGRILAEGLFITAWVAMWRPLEIFLFDWWPLRRLRRLQERLSVAEVECRAS